MKADRFRFRAWDGMRMTYSGIEFNGSTGKLRFVPVGILMQSTGLLDNKGIEIFEGDVVEYVRYSHSCDTEQRFKTGVMQWDDTRSGFAAREIGCEDGLRVLYFDVGYYAPEHNTIIGNIYEHPLLLEPTVGEYGGG